MGLQPAVLSDPSWARTRGQGSGCPSQVLRLADGALFLLSSFSAATFLTGRDLSDRELRLYFLSLDAAQFSSFWHFVLALK